MSSPFEQLLSDGEAAGALLACLYAEEMAPLRPVSPMVRDCLDMHTEGKVLPLLRQEHHPTFIARATCRACAWRLNHKTVVTVYARDDTTRLDAAIAMNTLRIYSSVLSAWDEVVTPHAAWLARVRELDMTFISLTATHLAALPNLRKLKWTCRDDDELPALDGCTALRELHVQARHLTHAPPTWVTNVTLWLNSHTTRDDLTRAMDALLYVPSVCIERQNWMDVDASSLIYAREFTLKQTELVDLTSFAFLLPPNLERVALRAFFLGDQPTALLTNRVIDDKTLQAMRRIPHVTLENFVLPPTWVDALKHTRTLSLVGCRFIETPVASDWDKFTALQTLDLHMESLYRMGRAMGLEALARLPRGARLRLCAASKRGIYDFDWKRVRDEATATLFELGVSAIPI